MDALTRYFLQALRQLRQQPAFSATAIGVLALGIGANAAIFTLINSMLLKPLRLTDAERLVGCFARSVETPDDYRAFSWAEYEALRERDEVFSGLAAHNTSLVGLEEGGVTRRAFAQVVSSNYFSVLGAPLSQGRAFGRDEERPGSGVPAVVVSDSFWRRRGSDPQMLGSTLRINGRAFTVVGVTAPEFSGMTALFRPELYFPLGVYETMMNDFDGARTSLADPAHRSLLLIGRLHDGITLESADERLAPAAEALADLGPSDGRWSLVARPLSRLGISTRPVEDSDLAAPVGLLLFLAAMVLVIASMNVANMMLTRGTTRRREIAIRLALGVPRRALVAQLFVEGLLLALLGGAVGLLLSFSGTRLLGESLARLAPIDLALYAAPDVRIVAATLLFCLGGTVVFALLPAWNLSRPALADDLKPGSAAPASGRRSRLLSRRNLLVVGQLALSLMLLTAAGLFVRSALRAGALEPGFETANQLVVEIDPSLAGADAVRGEAIVRDALGRLRALPGVESASLGGTVPFGMVSLGRQVQRATDPPVDPSDPATAAGVRGFRYNLVADGYFRTLGIPVERGRPFSASEASGLGGPKVVVLDRAAADMLWPEGDAVGRRIRLLGNDTGRPEVEAEVVGVVGDIQDHLIGRGPQPHVYVPYGQERVSDVTFHLRLAPLGDAELARLVGSVQSTLRAVDDRLPILAARTLEQHLDASSDVWLMRTASRMFTLFGVVAALLAAVGLYGVRAFSVARRTREIGIRIALGSSARGAQLLVLGEGLRVTAVGATIGLLLSLALGRLLAGMLYDVSAADPVVLVAAPLFLGSVSLVACWLPARRAARVLPATALRSE